MNKSAPAGQTTIPFVAVYTGSDTISRDRARETTVAAIQELYPSASEERFDPMTESFSQFAERMITPSLFSAFRVFFVNHAETLTPSELGELEHVAKFDIPDVCCLIEAEAAAAADADGGERGRGKAFNAWLKKVNARARELPGRIVVQEFPKPRDYEIGRWLVAQVPLIFGRTIAPADAEYLIDLIGYDFNTIYAELQKIDLYLPERKPLDRDSITDIVQGSRLINPWELAQAVGRRDLPRVLDMIESLFSASFYPPLFVSALYQHFWSLFRIRWFERKNPEKVRTFQRVSRGGDRQTQNELALEIGIAAGILTERQAGRIYPAIIKSDVVGQALAFNLSDYGAIFRLLADFDVGSKTGRIPASKSSFQLLCYRLARMPELGAAL